MKALLVMSAALLSLAPVRPVAADDEPVFSKGGTFDEGSGEALYRGICQGCHMSDGRGAAGAGTYPALANNPRLANAGYPLLVVLNGRRNMPPFAQSLDDAQVAAVVDYIRSHFGNTYADATSGADAARIRMPR